MPTLYTILYLVLGGCTGGFAQNFFFWGGGGGGGAGCAQICTNPGGGMQFREPQIQNGRLCHSQFVHDTNTLLGFCLAYLTMKKTKWPPMPGVKHSLHTIFHLNLYFKMADFVIDNLSITKTQH